MLRTVRSIRNEQSTAASRPPECQPAPRVGSDLSCINHDFSMMPVKSVDLIEKGQGVFFAQIAFQNHDSCLTFIENMDLRLKLARIILRNLHPQDMR